MQAAVVGVQALIGLIGGIFTHHAQAVKNEAEALNYAAPAVIQSLQNIVAAVNAGQVDAATGAAAIDTTFQQYEDVVYTQFKVKRKDCNGPCVVEKALKQGADAIKALLQSGKPGTATIPQTYANAGYNGTPATVVTYSGPVSSSSLLESITGEATGSGADGTSAWLPLALGGALLLAAMA